MSYLRRWSELYHDDKTLFPSEVVNTVTLFPRFRNVDNGKETNITAHLEGCVWNENSIEVSNKTGALGANRQFKVSLRVPYLSKYTGRKYVSAARWAQLPPAELGEYWSINPKQLPLAYNGRLEYSFPWDTPTNITRLENQLVQTNPNVRRLVDINEILLGIFPDLTEEENKKQSPEKFSWMGHMWQIVMQV